MSKMALCGVKAIAILNQTILTMNKATVILVDYPTPFKDPADGKVESVAHSMHTVATALVSHMLQNGQMC